MSALAFRSWSFWLLSQQISTQSNINCLRPPWIEDRNLLSNFLAWSRFNRYMPPFKTSPKYVFQLQFSIYIFNKLRCCHSYLKSFQTINWYSLVIRQRVEKWCYRSWYFPVWWIKGSWNFKKPLGLVTTGLCMDKGEKLF